MSADIVFKKESYDQDYWFQNKETYTLQAHLIGSFKGQEPPKFLRDYSNISSWGKMLEEKGAQSCCHCGSGKHWDNECRHSFKENWAAQANLSKSLQKKAQHKMNTMTSITLLGPIR